VNRDGMSSYKIDTLYEAIETEEIQFGHYKGRGKWENLRQIPTQQMRDALMNMIVYQGDTEFASVEQQRYLFDAGKFRVALVDNHVHQGVTHLLGGNLAEVLPLAAAFVVTKLDFFRFDSLV